ncbi:sugar ABC transporter substrate-binding protein [Sinorhizobium garamanticum]|uniref:Sugar ABC transporter substrate-binding protein n=1 Tax=Sinorhizobium garamanticum TaxID=680247 RepID=A0ABY8DM80_9HYPH|nr:sugar ABC transporter substrate-binding protein [Sinorhizobium garamanticum]WEX90043.1 sugar ABC transporter substrate-binding protein [Sinorhizobium garamanticum]
MKILATGLALAIGVAVGAAWAQDPYPAPKPLQASAQAPIKSFKGSKEAHIAYMPPATEFNYYIAIGEGIKKEAAKRGIDTFLLAPQSGADINGQMGMLQDVITRGVDAIILSTHDEHAAAPLVKRAVDAGIAVVIVNSDIPDFPAPVHAVVGYSQRKGTHKLGEYALKLTGGKPMIVGILEGQPGYHSTERVGGFLDAIKGSNFKVVASLDGKWNVEGGNAAAMDMLQAHPDIQLIFAANDYEIMGAAQAAKALGRTDLLLFGNDGDTGAGLEQIAAGNVTATVDTTPFVMGQIALAITADILDNKYPGGWVETPTQIVDKNNVIEILRHPETLYPMPSKAY